MVNKVMGIPGKRKRKGDNTLLLITTLVILVLMLISVLTLASSKTSDYLVEIPLKVDEKVNEILHLKQYSQDNASLSNQSETVSENETLIEVDEPVLDDPQENSDVQADAQENGGSGSDQSGQDNAESGTDSTLDLLGDLQELVDSIRNEQVTREEILDILLNFSTNTSNNNSSSSNAQSAQNSSTGDNTNTGANSSVSQNATDNSWLEDLIQSLLGSNNASTNEASVNSGHTAIRDTVVVYTGAEKYYDHGFVAMPEGECSIHLISSNEGEGKHTGSKIMMWKMSEDYNEAMVRGWLYGEQEFKECDNRPDCHQRMIFDNENSLFAYLVQYPENGSIMISKIIIAYECYDV